MPTIEKFLRFVSASTLAATIIFTVVVVVKELTKPKDILERIKIERCSSFSETENSPENEADMEKSAGECVFVPAAQLKETAFASSLANRHVQITVSS